METENYKPPNREKSKTSKKTLFWCGYCDCQLVSQDEKCLNCGKRENRKKLGLNQCEKNRI